MSKGIAEIGLGFWRFIFKVVEKIGLGFKNLIFGKPGIDGMSTKELKEYADEQITRKKLIEKLQSEGLMDGGDK